MSKSFFERVYGHDDVPAVRASINPPKALLWEYTQRSIDHSAHPTHYTARALEDLEDVFLCMQKSGVVDKVQINNRTAVNHVVGKFNGDPDTRYYIYETQGGLDVFRQVRYGTGVVDEPLLYNGSPKRPK